MPIVAGLETSYPQDFKSVSPSDYPSGQLIEDLPFETYQQVAAINASALKTFKRSPAHFWAERYVKPRKDTPALRFGRLLHMAILEPEALSKQLRVRPDVNIRTKAGKEDLDAWSLQQGPDAIIVSEAEAQQLTDMLKAAQAHTRLKKLLAHGKREACLFWTDPETQICAKARYDFVADGTQIIVDLKTTLDARPQPFTRDSYRYDYGLSAAHYLSGAEATGAANHKAFAVVAIEKEPPYGIQLYKFSQLELERSTQHYRVAMQSYAQCLRSDNWPGYAEEWDVLTCPPYAQWITQPQDEGV